MSAALLLLLLAPAGSAEIRVVSPSGPYMQIQTAVDAANDGDLVLVHSGTYDSFAVQAKSLTVCADTSAIVHLQGGVSVLDLTTGQTVCIIGLHAFGDPDAFPLMPWGLHAAGNLGSVRCDRCEFVASWADTDAALVESSTDVSFVACQLRGAEGVDVGGSGTRAEGSTLTFFDCTVQGGAGLPSNSSLFEGGNGGAGLHAETSTIFSSGSSFRGGDGGYGSFYPFGITAPGPGEGGAGVELAPGCLMRFLDSLMDGGEFGDPDYPDWDAPNAVGGTFTALSGTKRTMFVLNPARELTSLNFSLHGAASEGVYLLVGKQTGVQWDPARQANSLVGSPFRTLFVGTTNPSGNLTANLVLYDLGAGVQFDMFYLQPLFVGPSGAQQLGTPITLAALDQAF